MVITVYPVKQLTAALQDRALIDLSQCFVGERSPTEVIGQVRVPEKRTNMPNYAINQSSLQE